MPETNDKNHDLNNKPKSNTDEAGESKMSINLNPRLMDTLTAFALGILLAVVIVLLARSASDQSTSNSVSANSSSKMLLTPVYQKSVTKYLRPIKTLDEQDIERARIAWKFFENNYQAETGLVNAADKYPSTTMWDTGSALGATIAAYDLGFISEKDFDDRIILMLGSLYELKLFQNIAPNKVYDTVKGTMVDYKNRPTETGIGVSALDLARMISWLNILAGTHPKHAISAKNVMLRWDLNQLIKDGQMYGLAADPVTQEIRFLQEGRLGYEQYAGKVFKMIGFDQKVSSTYNNEFKAITNIYDVPIAYDSRDPRKYGAYNYVVTESYVMDVFEHGYDVETEPLTNNIYQVQKQRWLRTGQVTAVSEDNIDRKPRFVYNTIFAAGSPWNAITDTGKDMEELKTVSTKAALAMAYLYPDDDYSQELLNTISTAYDPERGWFSGIYEKGQGYNDVFTCNTNGIIMTTMLYKKYGPLNRVLAKAGKIIQYKKAVQP
ncbi:DUF3131 domain-containing protein [Methyloglobulus sp.]|uniref:DUF3131 domain-containing protein n=1 Tax=Methyloglobulus sp. TaxID=2518622 RepID=UPI0032B79D42